MSDRAFGVAEEFQKEIEEIEKKMTDQFKEMFNKFFVLYPEVELVCWEQWTPHFNDGEPCEFSVYCPPQAFLKGYKDHLSEEQWDDLDDYEKYGEETELCFYPDENVEKTIAEYKEELSKPQEERIWSWVTDDSLKRRIQNSEKIKADMEKFGLERAINLAKDLDAIGNISDNVLSTLGEGRIFVTRDGIEVEEVYHD